MSVTKEKEGKEAGIIRRMKETDIGEIAALERTCFKDPWSETLIGSGVRQGLDTVFVCELGGRIAGYAFLRLLSGEGEILRIAVDPPLRRKGIAAALMRAMLGSARRRGCFSLTLEVRESNEAALKLYMAFGFKAEALRRGYYQDPPEAAVIMWNRRV